MPPKNPAPDDGSDPLGSSQKSGDGGSPGGDAVEGTATAPGSSAAEAMASLVGVQNQVLEHYFRLQRAERKLSREARRSQPSDGRKAIRQIELERQRLGRDLHTGVGQLLAAIRLQVEIIQVYLPSPPPAVQHALDRLTELAAQALEQIRAVSRRLHPPEWQRLSLTDALRQLWELSGLPQRMDARISLESPLPECGIEAKTLIYRALQEALSNISRHSQATAASVSLAHGGGRLILKVWDNGVGFDAAAVWAAPASLAAGIGLRTIREQAGTMGGEMSVRSGPEGTTLEVSIPDEEGPSPRP